MSYDVRKRLFAADNRMQTLGLSVAAALLVVAPFFLGGFQTDLLATTLIFGLFATAFNLLFGYTGYLSFGHAMFVAASGYTVAKVVQVIAPALGFESVFGGATLLVVWVLALVLGMVMATLLAVVIGYLSVQLDEIYFAMITLSFGMALYVVANQDIIGSVLQGLGVGGGTFTNGSDGLTFRLGEVNLFGLEFRLVDIADPTAFYFLTLIVVALGMYALYRIVNSPFGTTCQAIRENPERARALGIDTQFHSWMTFIVSGAFSGLAGAMLVMLRTGILPADAFWTASATPVVMTVIGGPYSFFGPIVGSFTYQYLRWFIRQYPLLEEFWEFSFGFLLLIVVLYFDNGVYGGVDRLQTWLGTARQQYTDAGVAGVGTLIRETVTGWGAAVSTAARGRVSAVMSRLGIN
ncbi:MAG: ABC-type branched-chain amino acid transport system, permease component [uncultured archaeon A07HR60]|jgi:ABC-type branched-chain amino acid transport system, permease component|nr:MAG: ABC-type branched-chain amino acid transport system, permease component [uncultured archaeon A07HR60]